MTADNIKNIDTEKIAREGEKIYEKIKSDYEPHLIGKFLAIDTETGKVYLGDTSLQASQIARKDKAETIFYIKKIGFDVTMEYPGFSSRYLKSIK
ncbi:MAG: hypothetical protein JST55_14195 [Bacteroidetes bacterium]|nr:hypothetical protein [Bacteroidota bacterium]